ncbi:NAD dependent epimerase/dehydratase [Paragonimus skrjabini miyazakii]|uniref:NAD dependent epimerase/dehydratase n=1 Tax=Paragonimus skrjabini miyazakii TaxID=59628 RepID=A0A8S9YTW9_9TREM|nr:NAD dependent epimerase/dehydratase [Paragonimus skrjabini miyazakii]
MTQGDSDTSLTVIGAGLGRTGTNSLKLALEILYNKPCYHLKDLYSNRRHGVAKWLELEKRLKHSKTGQLDKSLCDEILRNYGSAVDHPVCAYYKELLDVYPNAKVILTVRNPEIWLAGCRSTILPRDLFSNRPWSFYFLRHVFGLKPLHEVYLDSWRRVFGQTMDFSSDTAMMNGFVAWTERVTQTVPADRLLIYDISKGWEPLCRFLGKPVPDCPFPHVNEYQELRRMVRLERRSTKLLQWGLPALLFGLVAIFLYHLFSRFF